MKTTWSIIALVICSMGAHNAAALSQHGVAEKSPLTGDLKPHFEANRGQAPQEVLFTARGLAYSMTLDCGGVRLALGGEHLGVRLVGHGASCAAKGLETLPGRSNYLRGSAKNHWLTDIPYHARVRLSAVYPGVDMEYYGRDGELEFDFIVAPGVNPKAIAIEYTGAKSVQLGTGAELIVNLKRGALVQHAPVAYQESPDGRKRVDVAYQLRSDGRVGFSLGHYDPARPLVIDPVLSYSGYIGGILDDSVNATALDGQGNIYLVGETRSDDFPVTSEALRTVNELNVADVFVTKISADGSTILYSTYLGGNQDDIAYGVAVDASGNAFITGKTKSPDFPGGNPDDFHTVSNDEVFVTKLNADGSLGYGRYVGGGSNDVGKAIALDGSGGVAVTGYTISTDFPVTAANALDGTLAGTVNADAFVLRLDAAGAVTYASFIGGTGVDQGEGIAVDGNGNIYVVGFTGSADLATTTGAYQTAAAGTALDAFVAKQLANNSGYGYVTYLGGTNADKGHAITVDGSGRAYVTGEAGDGFPMSNALQALYRGGVSDAFVTRLSAAGDALEFSTYLGGSTKDVGTAVALHSDGTLIVGGSTDSTNFTVFGAVQSKNAGMTDGFIAKLDPAQTGSDILRYSTYLGGANNDQVQTIRLDSEGNVYAGGWTDSTNFPRVGTLASSQDDGYYRDGFIAKIAETTSGGGTGTVSADLHLSIAVSSDPAEVNAMLTYTATIENLGPDGASNVTVTANPPSGLVFTNISAPGFDCAGSPTITCVGGSIPVGNSVVLQVSVLPVTEGTVSVSANVGAAEPDPDNSNNSFDISTNVVTTPANDGSTKDGSTDTSTSSGGGGGGAFDLGWLLLMMFFGLHHAAVLVRTGAGARQVQ